MPRRLVALLNGLSGGALLFLAGRVLVAAGPSTGPLLLAGILVVLGALGATAAVGMWRGSRLGAVLTLVIQGCHLVQLETTAFTYLTSLPVACVVGLRLDGHLYWLFTGHPAIEITPDSYRSAPWIGVNLPALAAVAVALVALRESYRIRPAAGG